MCGIVGILPLKNIESDIQPEAKEAIIRWLMTDILVRSEPRGGDATGMAVVFDNKNDWIMLKQPVKSPEFSTNIGQSKYTNQDELANFRRFMSGWRRIASQHAPTRVALGHVRKATKGSVTDPNNNHPIIIGNIIGVHNGKVENDDKIFSIFPEPARVGNVDSAAMFQLHYHMCQKMGGLSIATAEEIEKRVIGEYATLAVDITAPDKVIALKKMRPFEIAHIKSMGLLVVASEKKFIDDSFDQYNRLVLSLGTKSLPLIEEVAYKSIFETSVMEIDTSEGTSIDECLTFKSSPIGESHKLDEFKKITVSSNTSSVGRPYQGTGYQGTGYHHPYKHQGNTSQGSSNVTSLDIRKASVVDHSIIESSSSIKVDARVVDDVSDKSVIVNTGELLLDEDVLNKAKDAFTEALKPTSKTVLFRNKPVAELAEKLKVETLLKDAGENPQLPQRLNAKTLRQLIDDVYEQSFPEGFVYGYTKARSKYTDLTKQNLERKVLRAKSKHKSVNALVANLKSFILALLAWSQASEMDEVGTVHLDVSLLDFAKKWSPGFDPKKAMESLISCSKDTDKLYSMIDEVNMMFEHDDEDEEVNEETENEAELKALSAHVSEV